MNLIFIKKWWPYFLLIAIIIIGTWSRIAGIITDSFSFTYDVGRDMLEVNKIVYGHDFTLIGQTTGLAGLFYGPWWYYILSIPFLISGGNPQFIAFFIVFTGILTVVLMFYLGKKIEGNLLGLLFAVFCSFSPVMIGISSQIWNPNLIPLFVVLSLLLLHKLFLDNQGSKSANKSFLILGFIFGLILDFEIVFGVLFTAGTVLSIFILARNRINIKQYLLMLLGFLLTIFPRLLFEIRHNFIMTRSVIENLSKGSLAYNNFSYDRHIIDVAKTFKNLFDSTFVEQNSALGYIVILILLSIVFFYKDIGQKTKFYLKFATVVILTFFVGLSFLKEAVWSHYIIGIPVLYILILGLIVYSGRKCFKISLFVAVLTFIILLIVYIKNLNISFNLKPSWEGNAAVYRNQIAVVDYIYKYANGRRFNYVTYTPAVHDYTYQYLFLWYGNKIYGYNPSSSKEQLFFLIIEPEYDNPYFLKEWFNIRKNDGIKVKENVVKGGIRVQIRHH